MAETQTYEIVALPKLQSEPAPEPKLLQLAEKFQELRLNALRNSADAFASKYETEVEDGIARAIHRLKNAKALQFVAINAGPSTASTSENGDDIERILASDWVGLNILLGPEEGSELSVPSANLDPFPRMTATAPAPAWHSRITHRPAEAGELHFHINGMYVHPSARGGRVGKRLMDAALDRAKAAAVDAGSKLRVSLSAYSHNTAAIGLYKASGFKVTKEETSRSRPEFVAVHMELLVDAPLKG